MFGLAERERDVDKHVRFLVKQSSQMLSLGAAPKSVEQLIISCFHDNDIYTVEEGLQEVFEETKNYVSSQISQELKGLVVSIFLYDYLFALKGAQRKMMAEELMIRLPSEVIYIMLSMANADLNYVYCSHLSSIQLAFASQSFAKHVYVSVPEKNYEVTNYSAALSKITYYITHPDRQDVVKYAKVDENDEGYVEIDTAFSWVSHGRLPNKWRVKLDGETYLSSSVELINLVSSLYTSSKKIVALVSQDCITSKGVLEYSIRHYLLSNNYLDTIIKLPEKTIPGLDWDHVILVIDKERSKNQKIKVFDASKDFHVKNQRFKNVSIIKGWKDILSGLGNGKAKQLFEYDGELDYLSLLKNPHLLLAITDVWDTYNKKHFVQLGDIAQFWRGQPFKNPKIIPENEIVEDDEGVFFEASIKDIGSNYVLKQPVKRIRSRKVMTEKRQELILRPNDILISVKGAVGHVAIVPDTGRQTWIPNQTFQIIRANNIEDQLPIFYALLSYELQKIIAQRVSGGTIDQLKINDVKALPIPKITDKVREKVSTFHKNLTKINKQISRLEEERDGVFSELQDFIKIEYVKGRSLE